MRYWDTPGTWDREGSFVFLIVRSKRPEYARKQRAEQWMLQSKWVI